MTNFFQKTNKLKAKKLTAGFTLVETLVAISIFTLSVLSLIAVLASGTANTNYAKRKIIAEYLAQEGVEYIRNMRDTFVLYSSSNGWNDFKNKLVTPTASCDQLNGCYFDDQNLDFTGATSQAMTVIPVMACGNSCPPLLYQSTGIYAGRYNYAVGGVGSGFIRTIKIECPNNDCTNTDEVKIISNVSWTQASGTYNISFSENLFNWIQ